MATSLPPLKGIKDVFYETRVLMGRGYTIRRFANEVLEGVVDPVMLGYIEKGQRFPNDDLVRRIAEIRKEDPKELLSLLWRDRMIYAFARELRRVIVPGDTVETATDDQDADAGAIGEAAFAMTVSRAIAALPDDGSWVTIQTWKRRVQQVLSSLSDHKVPQFTSDTMHLLEAQGIVEIQDKKVRRIGRHYVPTSPEQRRSLAMEFFGIFTKGLLDKIVLDEQGTYLRNHYLHIPEERVREFQQRLDKAVRNIVEEFAAENDHTDKFLNVLMTSTMQ